MQNEEITIDGDNLIIKVDSQDEFGNSEFGVPKSIPISDILAIIGKDKIKKYLGY